MFLFPKFKSLSILPPYCSQEIPILVKQMLLEPRCKMAFNNNVNNKERTSCIPVDHAYVNLASSKYLWYSNEFENLDAYVDHPPEIPERNEGEI